MFAIRVGQTFPVARNAYEPQIREWEPIIDKIADLFMALVPASRFIPENGPDNKKQSLGMANAAKFFERLCKFMLSTIQTAAGRLGQPVSRLSARKECATTLKIC
ncbi:hypothetical protein [Desulfoglaeba alkanexedens]|uniref:Uncharacterized protein n=1 Tax=Desulfoglaeba alkanexedens ALDC TaxID=980445 RepID=A0A4P8L3K8_9BACT|nr:hypothetical protein [Desulfoglaeba alkanexedens]QCQ22273.1 hypothetical protein FDQ92_08940 [Desulfoglaeba alkanexedens ALDC]